MMNRFAANERRLLAGCAVLAALGLFSTPMRGSEGAEGVTAVASRVSRDYIRVRLPDGSFQAEAYAFGRGGYWRSPEKDDTIDGMDFMEVAQAVAGPLAAQNYVPDKDPSKTKLLIMVYWGTTDTPPQARETGMSEQDNPLQWDNARRTKLDYQNAGMLGYNSDSDALIGTYYGDQMELTALRWVHRDLVREIEAPRYFVVLMAYDFQRMWKLKKHRLLWETRFSINQPRNNFRKALPAMASFASAYFGRDSAGLVRQVVREGRVEVREPTLIDLLPSKP